MFSNSTYNFLKKFVQIILPAASALYFGLAQIWGLPAAEEVVGTIAIGTTFLGVCLGISTSTYEKSDAAYDGSLVVTEPETGPKNYLLELHSDPQDLEQKDSVRFKVESTEEPLVDDIE